MQEQEVIHNSKNFFMTQEKNEISKAINIVKSKMQRNISLTNR